MGEVIAMPFERRGDDSEVQARRQRLGRMIRIARGDLTQMQLAERLGMRQPAISAWEAGKVTLTAEALWSIESVLGLQHGWLGVASGLVNPALDPLIVLLEASISDGRQQRRAERDVR